MARTGPDPASEQNDPKTEEPRLGEGMAKMGPDLGSARNSPGSEAARVDAGGVEEVIALVEEEARIETRERVTGKVRVRTRVEVVQEPVRALLEEETVEVTRAPVDRMIDQVPEVRTEEGLTIVPVVEEVLVVEKRLVLKEELHIRRRTRTETVEVPVELRKERVEIERIPLAEDGS